MCIPFAYGQTTLGFEDFDGNAVNLNATANVSDYLSGGGTGGDVFGRVDGQLGGNGMPFDVADDTAADVSGAMTGSNFQLIQEVLLVKTPQHFSLLTIWMA